MKKRLSRLLRSFRMKRRFAVIFIPCASYGVDDAVAALAPRMRRRLRRRYLQLQLDRLVDSFGSVALESRLALPSRLLLFAHPNPAYTGFAVNSAAHAETLRATWWQYPGASYDFVLAHVCRGAEVLRCAAYREVFPDWISYKDDLDMYTGSTAANERWDQLADEIIGAFWESDTLTAATLRLQAVYRNALAQIHDTRRDEDGDSLNLIHFMGALDALTTSAD